MQQQDKSPHQQYLDSLPPQAKSPFLNWFIDNPIATNLLMLAIIFGGIWQALNLRLEMFDLPPSQVSISTVIEDATPSQVASEVSERIENAISDISGIESYYSSSSASFSSINVFAKNGTTVKQLAEDIRDEIENIRLPDYAETPTVMEGKYSMSLAWVSLMGDVSESTLKKYAIQLRDALQNHNDITYVEFSGVRDSELRVAIDKDLLEKHNLAFSQISNAMTQAIGDKAIGLIESGSGKVSVQIRGKEDNVDDYRDIVIKRSVDGYVLRLGDIATIEPTFTGRKRLSMMNGKTSVNLKIISEGRVNVVRAANAAKQIVAEFKENALPPTMDALVWRDRSTFVVDRLKLFQSSGMSAIFLVFLLLAMFLNWKLAFWVAVGVPISICGAFVMMGIMDISISMITLFGFILVLGIIVDDAIVIGESIYSQKTQTANPPDATIKGLARVSTAATFGVLTTVAAFLPLSSIDGFLGKIIADLAYVVMFCLIFSLIESKLILPSHLYHIRVPMKGDKRNWFTRLQQGIASSLEWFIHHLYRPTLRVALRFRYFTLFVFLSLFIFSGAAVMADIVQFKPFPDIENDDISLSINMRKDVTVERTHEVARQVTRTLESMNQSFRDSEKIDYDVIQNIYTSATDDRIRLNAELTSPDIRTISATEISERWKEAVGEIEDAEKSSFSGRRRPSQSDIEVQLKGKSRQNLLDASAFIQERLNQIDALTNVHDSEEDSGSDTFEIVLNDKADLYGITELNLAREIRAAYFGQTVKKIYRDGEEVPVKLRLEDEDDLTLADLYEQNVLGANNEPIPVREIATLETTKLPESVYRLDGKLSFVVYADTSGEVSADQILAQLNDEDFFNQVRRNFDVTVELGGEEAENKKTNDSLIQGFIISMFLIFALLAIPLKSFVQPVIIMLVIPFGIIGAIWGHYLMGHPISTFSLFGVLALSGVVVNDSLVFVSTTHQYRTEGFSLADALNRTGVRRFRPIILTSLTTYLGLMPLFFETSVQAQFLIPMAISLGYGILFATAITLFLIPVIYYIGTDIRWFYQRYSRVWNTLAGVAIVAFVYLERAWVMDLANKLLSLL